MDKFLPHQELSKYNRYILNRILAGFATNQEFNIYELVSESVSYKCILPSQNELIMETYHAIKEYLLLNQFIVEKNEMVAYFLTGRGIALIQAGSIEKYDITEFKKQKRSILQTLFSWKKYSPVNYLVSKGLIEHYE
ncbi:MAG: hypothetical protein K0Q79_2912 [Flavipsychrobacter sp.]|jgi:hypothetical protein|nr:hypothetical protein [Flavipsychrobacter sp.]